MYRDHLNNGPIIYNLYYVFNLINATYVFIDKPWTSEPQKAVSAIDCPTSKKMPK